MNGDDVSQSHSQVVSHNLVHADFVLLHTVIRQHNANGVLPLLSLQRQRAKQKQEKSLNGFCCFAMDACGEVVDCWTFHKV